MSRPRLEVADIFGRHGAAWRRANAGHVSLGQLQAMSAIVSCRTAALGGHVTRCEDCVHTEIAYNSCRNRHCPKCQGAAARDWLAEREAELLPVPYFHVVFTLPAAIADIAYQNKAVIYDLLFKASSETLLTIAADPKHLGARIGITAVLHTWGSAMTHHPHIHMIVPGGGISIDGSSWVRCRSGFLLPVRVLSTLFRRLMLEKLAAAHAAGKLQFFGEHRRLAAAAAFAACLAPLKTTRWFVYSKRPFAGPQAVLAYLARYTHRVAISNRRLVALDADGVTFRYKDYRRNGQERYRTMTLAPQRVHPPLPAPRPAQGLPPHPPLRALRERRAQGEHRPRQGAARRTRAANGARRDDQSHRHGANRPSSAMPVLRRAYDRRRDLRARRRPARPASVRTPDQDRGRMTPNTASPHRKPAGRRHRRRQPTTPSSDRPYAPDRQSHRHRPAWARETALCATPLAIPLPTKRSPTSIDPGPRCRPQPAATVKSP